MKNNDSILSKKEFEYFSILNNTEKLEYLYRKELLYQCANNPRMIDYKNKQQKESVKEAAKVNLIFIDKYIIISSNNRRAANITKMKLIEDGFILQKTNLENNYLMKNFNLTYKLNSCYMTVAVDAPLCYN